MIYEITPAQHQMLMMIHKATAHDPTGMASYRIPENDRPGLELIHALIDLQLVTNVNPRGHHMANAVFLTELGRAHLTVSGA
jgi:hypothetical protein